MKKRLLSMVLAVCMALTLLPTAALAADDTTIPGASGKAIYANGTPITVETGTPDASKTAVWYMNNGVKTYVNTSGEAGDIISTIYGGTEDAGTEVASTDITVNGGTFNFLFGGGSSGAVTGATNITINGGKIVYLIGGGYKDGATALSTNITMTGGTTEYLVGGGYSDGATVGRTSITLTGGSVSGSSSSGYLYGGGFNDGAAAVSTNVSVGGDSLVKYIYGGGCYGKVTDSATITLKDSAKISGYVFGGGQYLKATTGSTDITISGGSVGGLNAVNAGNVYGGGNGEAVLNNTSLKITGGTIASSVYGGGLSGDVKGSTSVSVGGTAAITGNVYGGCSGGKNGSNSATVGGTKNGLVAPVGKASTDSFTNLLYKADATTWAIKGTYTLANDLTIAEGETLTVNTAGDFSIAEGKILTVNGVLVLPAATDTAAEGFWSKFSGSGTVKISSTNYTTDGVLHGGAVTDTSLDLSAVTVKTAYKAGSGTVLWEPEMDGETTIGGTLTLDGATIGGDVTFPALASGKTITVATKGANTAKSLVWSTNGNTLALNGDGKLTLSGQISGKTNTLSVTGGTSLLVEGSGTTGGWGIETDSLTMDAGSTVTAKAGIHVTNYPDSTTWHSIKDSILHSGKPDLNKTWYEVLGNVKLAQDLTCISSNTHAFLLIGNEEISLTVPAGITLDLSAMTDAPDNYCLVNLGTLVNNGTIKMPAGTTVAQIKHMNFTGSGVVKVGDVTYGNNGEIPHIYTTAMDFSKSADQGNWSETATLETDGYTWDAKTNTLTLKNLQLTADNGYGNGVIKLPEGDVKLALEGANTVKNTGTDGVAILAVGSLTVSGSGELNATSNSNGISAFADLTISGATVTANSTSGVALFSNQSLTITNGTVTATAGNENAINSIKDLRISGGTVTATSTNGNGIHTNGNVVISGGSVRATGTRTAIWGATGITLTGMSITKPAGAVVGDSVKDPDGKAILLNGADVLDVTIEKTPSGGGGSSTTNTTNNTTTTKNPDGSTTVTNTTTKSDGTKETVATTTSTDGTKEAVTSTEKKQSDGSTVKTETVVKTDAKGNTTSASGTVTTDSKTGAVTVPAAVIETLAKTEGATLTVETPNATLKLDNAALQALTKQGGNTPALVITPVPFEKLPEKAQSNFEEATTYSFDVNGGGLNFGSGTVTVTLDYIRKATGSVVVVYYVDDNGNMTKMPGATFKNGKVTYKTNHFSLYAITEEPMPFTDVSVDAYYANAVLWAVDKGVTSGTSATTFAPDATCTRAQTVTFLWRAMGSPEPTTTVNPFTDVSADAYYYKAVLWAVEKGITGGTGATTFSPNAVCSRSQVVTFLWRAEGSPAATTANPFADVSGDAYYANAVLWAVEKGITSGTGATAFSPIATCTRAQIVTFLYRGLGE